MVKRTFEESVVRAVRAKWIISIFLSVVLVNVLFWMAIRHYEVEEFTSVGKTFTKAVDESLKLWMNQQVLSGKMIASDPKVINWIKLKEKTTTENDVMKKWLGYVVNNTPQLENLELYSFNRPDSPWQDVSSGEYALDSKYVSAREMNGIPIEDSGAVEQLLSGSQYYISSIMTLGEQQKPFFYLSIPIKRNGQVLGILNMVIRLSSLTEPLVNASAYEETGYLFLVDDRGKTIAHKMDKYVMSNEAYLQDIVNKLLVNLNIGKSVFEGSFQGELKSYYGVQANLDKPLTRNRWYIVFTQKDKEIHGISNLFVLISLVITAFMGLLGFAFHKSMSRKLEEMLKDLQGEEAHAHLIHALEEKKSEAIRQTALDPLTQLSHFQTVQKTLTQEIERCRVVDLPLVLVMFHVDAMGEFNDKFGHEIGDLMLNHIGRLLRIHYPAQVEVGRVYGDVYAIILSSQTLIEAVVSVEQFKKHYEAVELDLISEKPSLSFGIVQWRGETCEALIVEAEKQLKKAKKQGANQIKY